MKSNQKKADRRKTANHVKNLKDLTGQVFGTISVLRDTGERSANGLVLWLCRCGCGKEFTSPGYLLKDKDHCGCLKVKREPRARNDLTQAQLKAVIVYDPDSGKITKYESGVECNVSKNNGYLSFFIGGHNYSVARLAWLYMEGYWPENVIDHIDRDRGNNKWSNLRHVTTACNNKNKSLIDGPARKNRLGVSGVWYDPQKGKFRAAISVDRKKYILGQFKHLDDAVLARLAAEQCLGWATCDKSTTAHQYAVSNGLVCK